MSTAPSPVPALQPPATHDHPVRGPFNSWLLRVLEGHFHRGLGALRAELLGTLRGEVVEIGAGNGPTLRYLPAAVTRVHAVEPNPHFHRRLARTAADHGIDLVLHTTGGEAIDLPGSSVDAVVASWVLCTVADPAAVLAEAHRVLKPGGRLVFIEHVRAPEGSLVRGVQRLVKRPWRWVFEGCHTDRDTVATVQAAGFASVECRDVVLPTPFVPIRTQVAGVAVAGPVGA